MNFNRNTLFAPFGMLGEYSWAGVTGDIGAGAGSDSEIFQFRWTDSVNLALINKIRITGMRASTAFAAGSINIKATVARAFSGAGTGGNTVTITGDNQKLRTNMPTTKVGEIRFASTAALGAGTKTLDSADIGQIITHSSGGVGSATPIIGSIFLPSGELYNSEMDKGGHPIVLAANEGIIVRATVPATGVWNIGFQIQWAEVRDF